MAIDPVCKMKVEEAKAKYTLEAKNGKIYFCSQHCKDLYSANPAKYSK
ncbi:MAG: YHS domain-containing protein [Thermoprotei archaeon]